MISKKQTLAIMTVGVLCTTQGYSLVNKELRIRSSVVQGQDKYSYDLSVVADHSGFKKQNILDTSHEANALWSKLKSDIGTLGELAPGLQTGVQLDSFRVKIAPYRAGTSLLGSDGQGSRPAELKAAYDFAALYSSKADAILNQPTEANWVEMISGSRLDLARLALCVGVDYKANVEKSIKIPAFVQRNMSTFCEAGTSVASTLNLKLTLTSNETFVPNDDQIASYPTDTRYLNLYDLKHHTQLCSNTTVPNPSDVADLKAAGWIQSSATTRQEILGQCGAFVENNVLLKLASILDKTLTEVPLDKNISSYHRRLLTDLLESHQSTLFYSKAEIETRVKTRIQEVIKTFPSFAKAEIQSSDFNVPAFGAALDSGKELTPDEGLHLLFSSEGLPPSPFRDDLKSRNKEDQAQFIKDLKLTLAKECNFTDFNPRCLLLGVYGIGQNQYRLNVSYGQELLMSGFKLAVPANK